MHIQSLIHVDWETISSILVGMKLVLQRVESLRCFNFWASVQPWISETSTVYFILYHPFWTPTVELVFPLLIEGSENSRKNLQMDTIVKNAPICCLKIRAYLVVFQTKRDIKISQALSNDRKVAGVFFRIRGDHPQNVFSVSLELLAYYCWDPTVAKLSKLLGFGDVNGTLKGRTSEGVCGVQTPILTRYWENKGQSKLDSLGIQSSSQRIVQTHPKTLVVT